MKTGRILIFGMAILFFVSCNWKKKDVSKETPKIENPSPKNDTLKAKDTTATHQQTPTIPKEEMSRYANKRYSYSITYPSRILKAQGEADSGDGQVFLSTDNKAELRVYYDGRTALMADGLTFDEAYREDLSHKGEQVTYKMFDKSKKVYVISGLNKNKVFYTKVYISQEKCIIAATLTYDKTLRSTYDPLIKPIFESFK